MHYYSSFNSYWRCTVNKTNNRTRICTRVLACYIAMLLINASEALMRNHRVVLQMIIESSVSHCLVYQKSLLVPKFDTPIHAQSISHKLLAFQTKRMQSESFIMFSNVCTFTWNWIAFMTLLPDSSFNSWVFSVKVLLEKWGESKLRKENKLLLSCCNSCNKRQSWFSFILKKIIWQKLWATI